jgi:predicted NAD-dependent protein-ADP-ribosyltransferase YbiA (DUF1768 family)
MASVKKRKQDTKEENEDEKAKKHKVTTKTKKYEDVEDEQLWYKSTHNNRYACFSNFYPDVKESPLATTRQYLHELSEFVDGEANEGDVDNKTYQQKRLKEEGGFSYHGFWCKTAEHAYQAVGKYRHIKYVVHDILAQPTALKAKTRNTHWKKSYPINLKEWETKQFVVMKEILKAKMQQNPRIKKALIATGTAKLAEVPGRGGSKDIWAGLSGKHGELLMEVRDELIREGSKSPEPQHPVDIDVAGALSSSFVSSQPVVSTTV